MSDILVSGFEHKVGIHCGSTGMADVLRHSGVALSEAMVFGLGSGLGFYYLKDNRVSPSRQIAGRNWNLEENTAELLGLKLVSHTSDDPDAGWQAVKDAIDAGYPALAQCDLKYLPYWKATTSFNGHRIVVVGYNDATREAILADTHFEGLQRVSYEQLAASRASKAGPSFGNRQIFWTLEPGTARPIEDVVMSAIEKNARTMEDESDPGAGLLALRSFADEVADWRALEDAVWCYRFAYQVSERRGTGGGNFRAMYREFLFEAAEKFPSVVDKNLGISMARTAQAWTTLAEYMQSMSRTLESGEAGRDAVPEGFLSSFAEAVYQFESTFWDRIRRS